MEMTCFLYQCIEDFVTMRTFIAQTMDSLHMHT